MLAIAPSAHAAGKSVVKVLGSTTAGTASGEFDQPRGVAVNEMGTGGAVAGDFFVVDGLNRRIQHFRADGTWVAAFGRNVIKAAPTGGSTDLGDVFEVCTIAIDCQAGSVGAVATDHPGGELNNPQGIAIDQVDGSIYVTEAASRRVTKFRMEAGIPVFDRAWGADVDQPAGGNAFEICTVAANCKSAATGTTQAGGAFGASLAQLAIVPSGATGAGEILVADAGNRRVQRFEADGDFLYAFGWDVDSAGGSGELEKCTIACRQGVAAPSFTSPVLGQFANVQPIRVAVDSSNVVYTVEAGGATGSQVFRVQRFNAPLTSASEFSPANFNGATRASDVQVDPANDRVFVTRAAGTPQERHVLEFDASGTLLDTHALGAGIPTANGLGLNGSTGQVYLSSNHRIFVLDTPVPPLATLDPITIFDETSATFTGNVDPQGLSVTYRFEYLTEAAWQANPPADRFAGAATVPVPDGGPVPSGAPVSADIDGLEPNTTYRVRLVATKAFAGGTATTATQTFTTLATGPRIVAAGTFPGGSDTSVILFATVDPESQPTSLRFEYGTSTSYGQSTPVESVGSGDAERTILFRLNGLETDTTYHFKALASNPTGPVESADETFTTTTSAACPNEALRTGAAANLPDCRAYEMVTPIDKNGGDIETAEQEAGLGSHLSAAYRQASLDGDKITYSAATAFGDVVGGHFSNQYIATRGPAGWSSDAIAARRGKTLAEPDGGLGANLRWFTYGYFAGFSPDLSSAWIRDDNVDPLAPGALQGFANVYRRDTATGSYEPLTIQGPFGPNTRPLLDTSTLSNVGGPRFLGSSNDLSHQLVAAAAALTPEAVQDSFGFEPGPPEQLYDLVDGELHLVSVLPNGNAARTNSFAGAAGDGKAVETHYHMLKNAVSNDGSRIFWTTTNALVGGPGGLYVRENSGEEQSAFANGGANGTGNLTQGSPTVTSVTTSSGAFAVGQTVVGAHIPFGTTILAVAPGSITLSANATGSQSSVSLEGHSECVEPVKACTIHIAGVGDGSSDDPTDPTRAQFWAASDDGSLALYSLGTHPDRDLRLFDVDARTSTQIAGESLGVSAASEDLSHVYFVSREDLADGAVAGDLNLYHYEDGTHAFVGSLSSDDVDRLVRDVAGSPIRSGNLVGTGNLNIPSPVLNQTRTTPDGKHFTFMSNSRELSELSAGYDNTDLATGKPDFEVYHYDGESDELSCASCNPSGARPRGVLVRGPYSPLDLAFTNHPDLRVAASIPTHEQDLHASRILSDDGNRLFFHSDEALLPNDTNGVQDVYQWQALGTGQCDVGDADYYEQNNGCIYLISSGRDGAKSEFVDADPSGKEVFFSTNESLDPRDPGLRDIYVAKAGGGFPIPRATAGCEGEACQSPPPAPVDPTPSSASFSGPSDPRRASRQRRPRCRKGKRRARSRAGKFRCVNRKAAKRAKRANTHRRAAR